MEPWPRLPASSLSREPRNPDAAVDKGFHRRKHLDQQNARLITKVASGLAHPWWQPGMPKGVAIADWAENSVTYLAPSIAEGQGLPRQTNHQEGARITMDPGVSEDHAGTQGLDVRCPGEYVASVCGMVELDVFELHTSHEVATMFVAAGAENWPRPPENATRKTAMENQLMDWIDLDSVIVFPYQTPVGTKRPLEVEIAMSFFGGPRSRLRARQLPRTGREPGCSAWLTRCNKSVINVSSRKMVQSMRDARNSREQQSMDLLVPGDTEDIEYACAGVRIFEKAWTVLRGLGDRVLQDLHL